MASELKPPWKIFFLKQFRIFTHLFFFFFAVVVCSFALTVLGPVHRRSEQKATAGQRTGSSYHIVANLGLAVDDSLLSTDQTVQASHGGACGGRRSSSV